MKQQDGFLLLNKQGFKNWLFANQFNRSVKFIQEHHTYIPDYSNFTRKNYFSLLKGMESAHVARKMGGIAQQITTFPDGMIAICRPFDKIPTCIAGKNTGGLCIENLGNFDQAKDQMREEHKKTILFITALLCVRFGLEINTESIIYHHWHHTKSCPGSDFFGGNTKEKAKQNFIPEVISTLQSIYQNDPIIGKVNVTTNDKLNVRSGPGSQFKIIDKLNSGKTVTIRKTKNSWYEIDDNKWITSKFISF